MSNSGFSSLYERERLKVESRLLGAFKNREPISLYEPSRYILQSGGKRLRPLLVLLSARAVGGRFIKAYNASVAVELLHNFTLVHDDIMDNADKRRGIPTLHKKYDTSTAIIAGDSLLSLAYEFLLKDCNGNTKEILSAFTKGLVEVCEGQSLDKDYEIRSDVSIDEYIMMVEKKTAAMSEMCCSIGAMLGGGTAPEKKALGGFGKNIGIAFQIRDDLLDITGSEVEFGKVVGGDLIEGKKTYLFIKAMEKASGGKKEKLLEVIKNKGVKQEQVHEYRRLYEDLGVIDDAKELIRNYSEDAVRSVKKLKNKEDIDIFYWLSESLVKRIK